MFIRIAILGAFLLLSAGANAGVFVECKNVEVGNKILESVKVDLGINGETFIYGLRSLLEGNYLVFRSAKFFINGEGEKATAKISVNNGLISELIVLDQSERILFSATEADGRNTTGIEFTQHGDYPEETGVSLTLDGREASGDCKMGK